MPERAEAEGAAAAAGASALVDGSDASVSVLVLASESLWWDSLSGSSWEETAAKAATAMAERGRWRCPEKEAIVGERAAKPLSRNGTLVTKEETCARYLLYLRSVPCFTGRRGVRCACANTRFA